MGIIKLMEFRFKSKVIGICLVIIALIEQSNGIVSKLPFGPFNMTTNKSNINGVSSNNSNYILQSNAIPQYLDNSDLSDSSNIKATKDFNFKEDGLPPESEIVKPESPDNQDTSVLYDIGESETHGVMQSIDFDLTTGQHKGLNDELIKIYKQDSKLTEGEELNYSLKDKLKPINFEDNLEEANSPESERKDVDTQVVIQKMVDKVKDNKDSEFIRSDLKTEKHELNIPDNSFTFEENTLSDNSGIPELKKPEKPQEDDMGNLENIELEKMKDTELPENNIQNENVQKIEDIEDFEDIQKVDNIENSKNQQQGITQYSANNKINLIGLDNNSEFLTDETESLVNGNNPNIRELSVIDNNESTTVMDNKETEDLVISSNGIPSGPTVELDVSKEYKNINITNPIKESSLIIDHSLLPIRKPVSRFNRDGIIIEAIKENISSKGFHSRKRSPSLKSSFKATRTLQKFLLNTKSQLLKQRVLLSLLRGMRLDDLNLLLFITKELLEEKKEEEKIMKAMASSQVPDKPLLGKLWIDKQKRIRSRRPSTFSESN
ncbi:uncharacterized protein CMU_027180 [Cryptosporidium muris RN66]|uniref:Uncharacterized protein n=1 Tax=Cryptosporidium muris (strain RN66) TaxID=441375 RepID=B6ABF7_CRYMR|nr:uncharacterized protein CMU_027180 [Cryptosporidium muris RN66]EEA05709.1 hypothetical protein CMU_027180 [Cryptosporidium muris RN66]|eukprot:XP_002140058.1 hypothetical protein [Cryptosporidium muris RN66]